MTDKTDLLTMPKGEAVGMYQAWSYDQMQAYARANVLHHTATLQAEIEALRAEVDVLRVRLGALITAQHPPAVDDFVVTFRCESGDVVGTTTAKIHHVSRHDDGVIEVVIDHWPQETSAAAPTATDCPHCEGAGRHLHLAGTELEYTTRCYVCDPEPVNAPPRRVCQGTKKEH